MKHINMHIAINKLHAMQELANEVYYDWTNAMIDIALTIKKRVRQEYYEIAKETLRSTLNTGTMAVHNR